MSAWAFQRNRAGRGESQARQQELNRTIDKLNTGSMVFYGIAAAAGTTWLGLKLWPNGHARVQMTSPGGLDKSIGMELSVDFD